MSSPENAVDQDYVTNAIEEHRGTGDAHHDVPTIPDITGLMESFQTHTENESAHHEKTEIPAETNVDSAIAEHDVDSGSHTAEISRRVGQVATIVADQDTAHRELWRHK